MENPLAAVGSATVSISVEGKERLVMALCAVLAPDEPPLSVGVKAVRAEAMNCDLSARVST